MEQLRNLTMVEARKNNGDDDDDEDLVIGSSSFSGISSGSSSSSSSMELSDSFEEVTSNPLSDMSSLLHQLPIKRGLSRHYDGKSRSFTSLASVRSLEDLAKKPEERRRNAAMCRRSMNALSRHICKREWHSSNNPRNYSSSLSASKRINSSVNNFMATRPPIPPPHHTHRRSTTSTTTTTISTQTALFA